MSNPEFGTYLVDLATELGVAEMSEPDVALLLNLAGEAAHGVARPSAPLTCFLVGLAVGQGGDRLAQADAVARSVIERHTPQASS